MTFEFGELAPKMQEYILDNKDEFNVLKVIALAAYLNFEITKDSDELSEFLDNLKTEGWNDIYYQYKDTNYNVLDTTEAWSEVASARDDLECDLKYRAPIEYTDYIDFRQMAEDQITDIYDVYENATIEDFKINLIKAPFDCDYLNELFVIEDDY